MITIGRDLSGIIPTIRYIISSWLSPGILTVVNTAVNAYIYISKCIIVCHSAPDSAALVYTSSRAQAN